MRLLKVKFTDGRTLRLEVQSEDARFVLGYECDSEFGRIEREGAQQQHLIERACIAETTEYRENRKYGTLEKVK